MIFISLVKFRQKPTKEIIAENLKNIEKESKEGIKFLECTGRLEDTMQLL